MTRLCGICRQTGHNRQTCPQNPRHNQQSPPIQPALGTDLAVSAETARNMRKKWRDAVLDVCSLSALLQRFIKLSYEDLGQLPLINGGTWDSYSTLEDIRIIYPTWLKIRGYLDKNILTPSVIGSIIPAWKCGDSVLLSSENIQSLNAKHFTNIQSIRNRCFMLYKERNANRVTPPNETKKTIKIYNLRDTNYLIYWIRGNNMIEDLDAQENRLKYMGFLGKMDTFKVHTLNGHRFYLIPHRLDISPPYHPDTDKQFLIEPYCQIDIYEDMDLSVYIDVKTDLSELNQWKFGALKLDYLLREIIKLGGKDNDTFGSILDLHEDIILRTVTENEKDMAGIPSILTNIT